MLFMTGENILYVLAGITNSPAESLAGMESLVPVPSPFTRPPVEYPFTVTVPLSLIQIYDTKIKTIIYFPNLFTLILSYKDKKAYPGRSMPGTAFDGV